jgi:hypothetical protein
MKWIKRLNPFIRLRNNIRRRAAKKRGALLTERRLEWLDQQQPRIKVWYRDVNGVLVEVGEYKVSDYNSDRNPIKATTKEVAYAWNRSDSGVLGAARKALSPRKS